MCSFKNINLSDPDIKTDIEQRRTKHEGLLKNLSVKHTQHSDGYFGPQSMTWKIYREPSIVLGSMRALLLQIAHPAIAQGVALYSNFEKDVIGRAHRTFLSMVKIWFGDIPTANNSARRLHIIHSMIRGQKVWETEDETIVNPFCAADPELLFWVLATLVDTSLLLFEKTVRRLTPQEREQFFEESKITAQLMGIPLGDYPETLKGFYIRYEKILRDGTLQLTNEGKAIRNALFKTPYPIRRMNEILAVGFFPESVKPLFHFRPNAWIVKSIVYGARVINWLCPNDLRYAPHYHQAKFRIALSERQKPRIVERIHYWMSTHINWYFISNKLTIKKS